MLKEIENENDIKEMIKSPSIIQRKSSLKSLSDSSIISYNNYADLLNINEKKEENTKKEKGKKKILLNQMEEKSNFHTLDMNTINYPKLNKENKTILKLYKISSYNKNKTNYIKQRFLELKDLNNKININPNKNNYNPFNNYLYSKTENLINPSKLINQFYSKIEERKNKNKSIKIINKDYFSHTLQNKGKKLLNDVISFKFNDEDDIEEFKNQFEKGKRSPFGCLDFQKKFKSYFNNSNKYKRDFGKNKIQILKQNIDYKYIL